MQPPSINSSVSALRFFFTVTLDRPDLSRRLTVVPYPRRIPVVLSVEEVTVLLRAATAPKYKAAFATAYGAGLRVSEVVALKVGDIDSERMLLRVERGKGRKDRHAMLSPQLLELLRAWWREGRRRSLLLPGGWLFPGRNPVEPLSAHQLCRAVRAAAQAAGIKKNADLRRRLDDRREKRIARFRVGDAQWALATAKAIVGPAGIAFHALEERQDLSVAPAAVAHLRPGIEVLGLAADKHHSVN
jgi:integrase